MTRQYDDFAEVESEIREKAPPVVYKYRTWSDDNHKNMLIKHQIWFSHPYDLNDPLDVRPPLAYDIAEIESYTFFEKLLNSVPHSMLSIGDAAEKMSVATRQWNIIKANPEAHFNANRQEMESREKYDQHGIFSTSNDALSKQTWELYGEGFTGYCLGFNTVELCRQMNCTVGEVRYSDDPFQYSFLGKRDDLDIMLYKKEIWKHEREFRFATFGIGIYSDRLRTFTPDIVVEIILGHNIPADYEKQIKENLERYYPKNLPIYKTVLTADGILRKDRIA